MDINEDIAAAILEQRCTYCGARPGHPCVIVRGRFRHLPTRPHADRSRSGHGIWVKRLLDGHSSPPRARKGS